MRIVEYEEYDNEEKVKLITDWYEKKGFPYKKGDVFIVDFQDGDNVWTNKGIFDFYELELIKEEEKNND